ncbi:hypothetical protein IEQ34_022109 [Dendrobium chrysotoxum]|uniref:Uncharacterized protein n=1 Tax=Dendrobium chrysotoxum TaxID=161865 RepID=A0AAV7FY11_DENCH|nr:hypothetical protein IEQ34_022109 [Dendrobium chrysotoxum]
MEKMTGLIEKWGRMKDLPVPSHVGEEDILRILNILDVKHLLFEVCYLTKYIEEEFLFKVGLSIQAGRSEAKIVIEDFKKSIDFKTIIQDHLQEDHEHIYNIKVKALEQQYMDESFTQGFLKGVRLVQRKAGVKIDWLTTSQASEDPSSNLDGAEIESELRQTFSSDDEFIDVE